MSSNTNIIPGNVVIGQSGGPTAVINQSLVGIVEALRDVEGIDKIYGAVHAVRGMVNNHFVELQNLPQELLERIALTPSAALGSSRDKPDEEYCRKILTSFEAQNVRYFFYIGGNDSSDTCRIINEMAIADNYELRCFHVPKTIDNDLMCNDHTPGFASAAKFVAQAFMGDNCDNRALPGIKINVVMGRHAGFLTAASMLARQNPGDGPHLIYVPEAAFDEDQFIADVKRIFEEQGRCLIAVSEGIHDKEGTPMLQKLATEIEKDDHGNVQLSGTGALGDFLVNLIKDRLGSDLRVRADTFGYLQRSFAGLHSVVDGREARQVGARAAELSIAGEFSDGSVAIVRTSDSPYLVEFNRVELSDVAAKTKVLDDKYLLNGNDIHESFADYLKPLIPDLPHIGQLPIPELIKN